jgi:hypothetical protein
MFQSRFSLKPGRSGWQFLVLLTTLAAGFSTACRKAPATPATTVSADTWAVVDGRQIMRADVDQAYRPCETRLNALGRRILTAKLSL